MRGPPENQDSILPISPDTGQTIAVLGQIAESPLFQGTGCAIVNARQADIPLEEIRKIGGESVLYAKGCLDGQTTTEELLSEAGRTAEKADLAVVLMGTYLPGESDDYDHKNMDAAPAHRKLLERVLEVQDNTIVILFNGNTVAMPWAGRVKAILQMGYAGEGAGKALADLLFGTACPGGKLAATIPESLKDTPAYLDFPTKAMSAVTGKAYLQDTAITTNEAAGCCFPLDTVSAILHLHVPTWKPAARLTPGPTRFP